MPILDGVVPGLSQAEPMVLVQEMTYIRRIRAKVTCELKIFCTTNMFVYGHYGSQTMEHYMAIYYSRRCILYRWCSHEAILRGWAQVSDYMMARHSRSVWLTKLSFIPSYSRCSKRCLQSEQWRSQNRLWVDMLPDCYHSNLSSGLYPD
jgi:hypothetical protein